MKIKGKTIATYLIVFILLLWGPTSYAAETLSEMQYDQSSFEESYNKATVNTNAGIKSTSPNDSLINSVTSIIVRLINPIPSIASLLMSITTSDNFDSTFTIQDLIFGEIGLFNINFFQPEETVSAHKAIAEQVSIWFYALRNIALVINLGILIYVAIRMAISTIAEEKARFKKMLVDWLIGMIIIFLLPYIMSVLIALSEALVNLLKGALAHTDLVGKQKIETKILGNMLYTQERGFSIIIPSLTYWVLVFYQVKFFFMYLRRVISTAFLIIISPLISATYAIDKIGDGASQAWSTWIKEFAINVFIQPLHAFLYLLFMVTAYNIVEKAPLLAIIFLMALSRGERVVRNVFRIQNLESIKSMADNFKFDSLKQAVK